MNSVLELFILRRLESIHNFMSLAQFSRHPGVLASAVMLWAENYNLIAMLPANPFSDTLGGTIYVVVLASLEWRMGPAQVSCGTEISSGVLSE